jgi:hypothetical protein
MSIVIACVDCNDCNECDDCNECRDDCNECRDDCVDCCFFVCCFLMYGNSNVNCGITGRNCEIADRQAEVKYFFSLIMQNLFYSHQVVFVPWQQLKTR